MDNLTTILPSHIDIDKLSFKFTTFSITETIAGKTIYFDEPFKNKHVMTLTSIEGTAGYPTLHVYAYQLGSYRISVQVTSGVLQVYGLSIGY